MHKTDTAERAGHQHKVHQRGELFQLLFNQLVGAR
jgi:hypothetical protein